jgi:syntaxin 7
MGPRGKDENKLRGIVLFHSSPVRYAFTTLTQINHLQQQHIQFHFHASTLILTFQFHQFPIPISPIFSTNSEGYTLIKMSFQDIQSGRRNLINGKQDPTQAVASGVFQINTAVSTFQRLVNTLGTPKDTPELREKL